MANGVALLFPTETLDYRTGQDRDQNRIAKDDPGLPSCDVEW